MSVLSKRLGLDGSVALAFVTIIVLVAILASSGVVGASHHLLDADPHLRPGGEHWLGTDALGRDVAARVIQGARVSIGAGVLAAVGTVGIGSTLGAIAGLRGGTTDRMLVALADSVAAIPALVALLGIGIALGPGLGTIAFAIAATQWVSVFRAVRIESARLREADFIRAAEAMGAGTLHQLRVHIVPNLLPLLSTSFALVFTWSVKAEAVLGYLGLSSTELPSWGRIMAEGGSEMARGIWWPILGAALPLALLVLSVQVLADRLSRDEPR